MPGKYLYVFELKDGGDTSEYLVYAASEVEATRKFTTWTSVDEPVLLRREPW